MQSRFSVLALVSVFAATALLGDDVFAGQKQGGGSFAAPTKVKKATKKKKAKPKKERTPSKTRAAKKRKQAPEKKKRRASQPKKRVAKRKTQTTTRNADGVYQVVANLLNNNTGETCYSASLKIRIKNGTGRYQIGFGPLLGARVTGGRFVISTLRVSKYFNRRWSGGGGVPGSRGAATSGTMRAVDPRGKTCNWSLRISRL